MSVPSSGAHADAAVGADGVLGSPDHPDDARPGSTLTTECDLDTQDAQYYLTAKPSVLGQVARFYEWRINGLELLLIGQFFAAWERWISPPIPCANRPKGPRAGSEGRQTYG